MKHYEVLFIVKPTLAEDETAGRLEFVKELLLKNGGEIKSTVAMGTRRLAYKIKKYERGTYFVIYFKAPPALISELERVLGITEEIIRFLIIKYENKKEITAWEKLSEGFKNARLRPPREREERPERGRYRRGEERGEERREGGGEERSEERVEERVEERGEFAAGEAADEVGGVISGGGQGVKTAAEGGLAGDNSGGQAAAPAKE